MDMDSAQQVLIVDDSLVARLTLKKIFGKLYPQYIIVDLEKPGDAIELIQRMKFSLASLDYNMPDMNGEELGTELVKQQPDIKIAILTANIQKAISERISNRGFVHIPKPIGEETVHKLVKILGTV